MHLQTSLFVLGLSAPLALSQLLEVSLSDDDSSCVIYADGVMGCDDSYSESFGTPDEDAKCSIDHYSVSICDSGTIVLGGSGFQSLPIVFYSDDDTRMRCNVPTMSVGEGCTPTNVPDPSATPIESS